MGREIGTSALSEVPVRVRLVGWFFMLSAASGFISVLSSPAGHALRASFAIAVPEGVVGFVVGFALRRGGRRAYFAALALLMLSMVDGAVFFLGRESGPLSSRLAALVIVLAGMAVLLAALLTRPPSTWASRSGARPMADDPSSE